MNAQFPLDQATLPEPSGSVARVALGVSYRGTAYEGWQSQPSGRTVQDKLEQALAAFLALPREQVRTLCAGRTDAGVHALNQVVHLADVPQRDAFSWVRGTNRYLPDDVAVQWAQPVAAHFHARNSALGRRYRYLLREAAVRPALEHGLVGWTFRPLEQEPMQQAAKCLLGEHDFSAFRAAQCQAATPVKTLRALHIGCEGQPMNRLWRFEFDASAFLHHMVRNIMGCLLAVGSGRRPASWMSEVLASRQREQAAPTFSPNGLYFIGPYYDAAHKIPEYLT